jgi:hypothetical protein
MIIDATPFHYCFDVDAVYRTQAMRDFILTSGSKTVAFYGHSSSLDADTTTRRDTDSALSADDSPSLIRVCQLLMRRSLTFQAGLGRSSRRAYSCR